MRTEKEIMDLILSVARADERIRAVSMEGSRADPTVVKDKYQDFDISFYVTDVKSFIDNRSWISKFGSPLIIQEPDWVDTVTDWFGNKEHDSQRSYGWLMVFSDGNRIDLGVISVNATDLLVPKGEPTVTLLDKDGLLPIYPMPNNKVYWVKAPDDNQYHACCNEFWWCLNNVAKGIARDELPYAMEMLNLIVRKMLNKMIDWYIGTQTGFSVATGKMGKYYKRYLSPDLYRQYASTYSGSDYADIWASVDEMCDLFHLLAVGVAAHFGFNYRQNEEDGMREYFRMVRENIL